MMRVGRSCSALISIGKLAGTILLVSTSLAYGQFFTYSQWERLPEEEERQVYIAVR